MFILHSNNDVGSRGKLFVRRGGEKWFKHQNKWDYFRTSKCFCFIQQSNLANSIGKMSVYWQSHSHIHTRRRQENNTIIAVVSFPISCNCLTLDHSNHSTISPMRDNLRGHYLLTDCLLGPAGNGGVKQRLHSAPVPGLKQTQQVKK